MQEGNAVRTGRVEAYLRSAMLAALTAVCAQVAIPAGMAPVSLATVPVLVGAALLGGRYAMLPPVIYVMMGLAGLPVFAGFSGGAGVLLGPTGGYIVGYIPCAGLAAWAMKGTSSLGRRCAGMACGMAACYALGTAWLCLVGHVGVAGALAAGVLPFIPGDAVKVLLAAWLSIRVEKALGRGR